MRRLVPVFEVISCSRLRDWHWEKMSEIIGTDLLRVFRGRGFEKMHRKEDCRIRRIEYRDVRGFGPQPTRHTIKATGVRGREGGSYKRPSTLPSLPHRLSPE